MNKIGYLFFFIIFVLLGLVIYYVLIPIIKKKKDISSPPLNNFKKCNFLYDEKLVAWNKSPPLDYNPQTLRLSQNKQRRTYKLSLYNGDFIFNSNINKYNINQVKKFYKYYLQKLASFVSYANIDLVYIKIGSSAYYDPQIIFENFIKILPSYTQVGIVGYINPLDANYNLTYYNDDYKLNLDYRYIFGGYGSYKSTDSRYGLCGKYGFDCPKTASVSDCTSENENNVCPLKTPGSCIDNTCSNFSYACPNTMEQFMAQINIINYMVALNNSTSANKCQMITKVIFDSDSFGEYYNNQETICQLVQAAKLFPYLTDLINPTNPEGNTECINDPQYGYCTFTDSNDQPVCPNINVITNINNNVDYNSSFEYSKLYWIGELDGCSCNQKCKFKDSCPTIKVAKENGCCLKSDTDVECYAKCASCYSNCRLNSIYTKYINNPLGLLNKLKEMGVYNPVLYKSFYKNKIPAFSIENIGGVTFDNSNLCIQKLFGRLPQNMNDNVSSEKDTACGTFNGFGSWDWSKFEDFMDLFYNDVLVASGNKAQLNEMCIYEWQFIPFTWLSLTDQQDITNMLINDNGNF